MMRNRQAGTHRPLASSPETAATLSIVMVAAGSSEARYRAAGVLLDSSACFNAQVIVVSRGDPEPALQSLLNRGGAQLVDAPDGCTRAEMCDLGMRQVTGSIVAVRDDVEVGDAAWLGAFGRLVPRVPAEAGEERELAIAVGAERVVMDTMLPAHSPSGNARPVVAPLADLPRSPAASVEMAAIM